MVEYDKSNMLSILESFPEQCRDAVNLAKGVKVKKGIKNIIICGMGGSGIGGELIKQFGNSIPIISHHDYGIPKETDKNSLVVVISYSGNTEEAVSNYDEAKRKGAKILCITSGGKIAEKDKNSRIIPSGLPPRHAAGYLFLLPLIVLSNNKLIPNQNINDSMRLLDFKQTSKDAFMLAKKINGNIPIFYSGEELKTVAYSFKTHVNENAKQPAFNNVFPEMNHNEINGFKRLTSKIITVFIENKKDPMKIKKRMMITKKLIKETTSVIEINVKGKTMIDRVLTTMYLGDLMSYYLALMNKLDPTPVEVVERLKKKLKD